MSVPKIHKKAVVLSVVCILSFLSKQVFDYMAAQEAHLLIVFPYMLYTIIIVPIIYICGAGALLLFLAPMIKTDHGHNLNKKVLFVFSFGFIFLYVIAVIAFASSFFSIGYPVWCWNVLQWLCKNPLIFSFVGVLIFLGLFVSNEEK